MKTKKVCYSDFDIYLFTERYYGRRFSLTLWLISRKIMQAEGLNMDNAIRQIDVIFVLSAVFFHLTMQVSLEMHNQKEDILI